MEWIIRNFMGFRTDRETWLETGLKWFLLAVFWGGAVTLLVSGLWCLWHGARSKRWLQTAGRMLSWDIKAVRDSVDPLPGGENFSYRLRMAYVYQVDGHEYVGQRLYFGQGLFPTASSDPLWRRVNRYQPSDVVKVFYSKSRPSLCVLQPGTSFQAWFFVVVGVGLLTALIYVTCSGSRLN